MGTYNVVVLAKTGDKITEIIIKDITCAQIKTLRMLHGKDNVMPCLIVNEKEV